MNKWILLTTSLTLLQLPGFAWGRQLPTNQESAQLQNLSQQFPLNTDQNWYTEETYLLWKPYMEDLDFGVRITREGETPAFFNHIMKIKRINFEWDSGVRLTLGRYLAHHDLWDINLATTYYYTEAHDHVNAGADDPVGFIPAFVTDFIVDSQKNSLDWRLNYFTWDLNAGRQFIISPKVVLHPYLGIRAALIYQDYHTKHRRVAFFTFDPTPTQLSTRIQIDTNFWGIGPRAGTNFVFYMNRHWTFVGNFAASFLLGHSDSNEKIKIVQSVADVSSSLLIHNPEADRAIRTNLEGSLGLGWETWIRNHSVRIAPSFVLEGSLWFAMNQLPRFFVKNGESLDASINIDTIRTHGNLAFMGFAFNLQIDF